ncbi:MAG: hypothetical protein Kilf2KO_39180 [Rhodospirillales bacterium]
MTTTTASSGRRSALLAALRAGLGLDSRAEGEAEAGEILATAERSGFRLLLIGRSLVLLLIAIWQAYGFTIHGNPAGLLLSIALLGVGLLILYSLNTRHERRWHRYALIGLDIAAVTVAASVLPLLTHEAVPKIMIFRAYGSHLLFLLVVVTALSLMPGLVLFTGALVAGGYWVVIAVILSEQERVLSWRDMPNDPDAATYLALLLDVDFINWGIRYEETVVILVSALLLALAVGRARRAVLAFAQAERQRLRAEEIFGHFVPRDVAAEILEQPDALRPKVQTATVLFLDIEGFTGFSETREAEVVMQALDGFFSDAAREVAEQGGTALSYAGDAMLATFGLPRATDRPAAAAIAAADALLRFSSQSRYDGTSFKLRIGLASGPLAAGSIGSSQRSYTVYGDTVNLAQRLEQANKRADSRLLVCADTWRAAGSPAGFEPVGAVDLPGRQVPVEAYRLVGSREGAL